MKWQHPTNERLGAVLIFALLVMVAAMGILGGIMQLAVTQAVSGQSEWDASMKRIRLENSRALARQFILSQMWRGTGTFPWPVGETSVPLARLNNAATGGLGGFDLDSLGTASSPAPEEGFWYMVPTTRVDRINPFNLMERGGFQSTWVNAKLRNGSDDAAGNSVAWGFQVRTRSPIVAGYSFVNHRPAQNAMPSQRHINMQASDFVFGFNGMPRVPLASVTNSTTSLGVDATGFVGFLDVPKSEAAFGDPNSDVRGVSYDFLDANTTAVVTVDLNDFNHTTITGDDCLYYEVPKTVDLRTADGQIRYNIPVKKLILVGGDGVFRSIPVQVQVGKDNRNLEQIELRGDNARAVYFYRFGDFPVRITTLQTSARRWRLGMTIYGSTTFNLAGDLTIVGGLRTPSLIQGSTAALFIEPESSRPWKLDAIADRMMWLEDTREKN